MRQTRNSRLLAGHWLRTLVVLCVVFAVALESPLRGGGVAPTWFSLGSAGTDGVSTLATGAPSSLGEQGEPDLAARKHKGGKKGKKGKKAHKKDRQKADKKAKQKKHKAAKKGEKGKDDKRKADKKGKSKRDEKDERRRHNAGSNTSSRRDRNGEGKQDRRNQPKKRSAATEGTVDDSTATTLTFAPAIDAQVSEANPDFNYGGFSRLLIDGGDDPQVASYLLFTISGVTAPIEQATLRLRVRPKNGTKDGPELQSTSTDWTETGLTWNTRPAPAGDVLDDKGKLDEGSWVEYDVTPGVSGNGSVAFVLLPQTDDGVFFHSRESDYPPQLILTLADGASTPSPEPTPDPAPAPDPTSTPAPDPTSTPVPAPDPTATPDPTPTLPPDPGSGAGVTLLAAGDIADCDSNGDEATAALLDGLPGTVAALGDIAYERGSSEEFAKCFEPSWGRHKHRTRPAVGNHEYLTNGAAGYFDYFGAAAGDRDQGYYSYDLGAWHIVVLNSNCSKIGGCDEGSRQVQWLRQDLAANPAACTLAYWHHPRYSFGKYGNDDEMQALWQALYDHGAEIVLSGHSHNYQRYAPQDNNGNRDNEGIRQFVVGTGGKNTIRLDGTPPRNVEAHNDDTFGVLRLTLRPNGYDWAFVPVAGESFSDSGADGCH